MKDFLPLLLPVVVAFLTGLIVQGLKKAISAIDATPAIVKQIIAVVVAFALTKLGSLTGVAAPTDLGGLSPDTVSALLSAALAMLFHIGYKADQAKA